MLRITLHTVSTTSGHFVGELSIDPAQGGAFGLAVTNFNGILRLAAVEDITNSVDVWTFNTQSTPFASRGTIVPTQGGAAADLFFGTLAEADVASTVFGHSPTKIGAEML